MTLFDTNYASTPAGHSLKTRVRNAFLRVLNAYDVIRQRQVLDSLDDARLADLGLTIRDAHTEARRPVWNVPAQWVGRCR